MIIGTGSLLGLAAIAFGVTGCGCSSSVDNNSSNKESSVVASNESSESSSTTGSSKEVVSSSSEQTHTHKYGSEWKSDGSKHWHECSCGAKSDEAEHTNETKTTSKATVSKNGTKVDTCTVCSYAQTPYEYQPYMDNYDWDKVFFNYSDNLTSSILTDHSYDYTLVLKGYNYAGTISSGDTWTEARVERNGGIIKVTTSEIKATEPGGTEKGDTDYGVTRYIYARETTDGSLSIDIIDYDDDAQTWSGWSYYDPTISDFAELGGVLNILNYSYNSDYYEDAYKKTHYTYNEDKEAYVWNVKDYHYNDFSDDIRNGTKTLYFDFGKVTGGDFSYTTSNRTGINFESSFRVDYSCEELVLPSYTLSE